MALSPHAIQSIAAFGVIEPLFSAWQKLKIVPLTEAVIHQHRCKLVRHQWMAHAFSSAAIMMLLLEDIVVEVALGTIFRL